MLWPAETLHPTLGVAISLDAAPVRAALAAFVVRIAGLIVLIAAFVTLTTMIVLGNRLIFPMLDLRNRLVKDPKKFETLDVPKANRADEFGDVVRAFNGLLSELFDSWRGLEQRVAERTTELANLNENLTLEVKERKQAETALAQSEKLYRNLVKLSPNAIYVQVEGRIVLANSSACKAFRATQQRLIGKPSVELFHPDDRGNIEKRRRVAHQIGGTMPFIEVKHLRLDGTVFDGESTGTHIVWDGRPAILVVVRDITEHKKSEQILVDARDVAEQANRSKSEFLATMSHEIRTPLNAILGLSEIVLDTELSTSQRDYIRIVRGSGETLLAIINDILDFAKMEAGKLLLDGADFDLNDTLSSVIDLMEAKANEKGLELNCSISEDAPLSL